MNNLVLPKGKIENIDMVIFDKDGTLIDVHHYWCSMIEFRAKFFVELLKNEDIDLDKLYNDLIDSMGINLLTKKMKPEGPVGIKPRTFIVEVALETINKYTKNCTKDDVIDIFAKVDEYSKSKLKEIVKPLPSVEELLGNLKAKDILITIATTDLTNRAILAMKDLGFEEYFIDIAGADLVKNAKPSPDLVDYLINKHNVPLDKIVVVGDSMADLNMAKNAKCQFLGVKTGLCTDEFINDAEYLIEDMSEIEVI